MRFGISDLSTIRQMVRGEANSAGLSEERARDVVLVANEMATNSVRHGGGHGTFRSWCDDDTLVIEVSDEGSDGAGSSRTGKPRARGGGFGLWLISQLAESVQIDSRKGGTVVRARFGLDEAPVRSG